MENTLNKPGIAGMSCLWFAAIILIPAGGAVMAQEQSV